jgi:hypothetical protein
MSEIQKVNLVGIHGDHLDDDIVVLSFEREPESWQKVWRDGLAPQLSTAGLRSFGAALGRAVK